VAYTVGITGNVASGKSSVAKVWREAGVPVMDADRLARRAVSPGTAGLDTVREVFGAEMITGSGELDRRKLGRLVFRDQGARNILESIVHPVVLKELDAWTQARAREGEPLIGCELPLLFELGMEKDFDRVVFVDARTSVRSRRMVDNRGMDREEARRIMESQGDPAAKRTQAHEVIENNAGMAELERGALRALARSRQAALVPLRMDLHLHSLASFDSLSDPEDILDRAIRCGIGRIALTDHDTLGVARLFHERYPSLVIPGEEIKAAEGVDVIGLHLTREIPGGVPAQTAISMIRDQGGVAYLPHPYAPGKGGGGRIAAELGSVCDVIEVFNARIHQAARQEAALNLQLRLGKLAGAGSDAHTIREVGYTWVETPAHANTPEELLGALSEGVIHGRMSSRSVHLASTWAKVRKKISRLVQKHEGRTGVGPVDGGSRAGEAGDGAAGGKRAGGVV